MVKVLRQNSNSGVKLEEILNSEEFQKIAVEITDTVNFLSKKGWTPATSSNFSARIPGNHKLIAASKSGIDKNLFRTEHVMVVDNNGNAYAPKNSAPSAEILIHMKLYEDPMIGAVLHTHSVNGTVISNLFAKQKQITFSGFEILKGLSGNSTHCMSEQVPILLNSQDMNALSSEIGRYKNTYPEWHAFLIKGHGLYSWGMTLADAKRHIEVFEFLFECFLKEKQ